MKILADYFFLQFLADKFVSLFTFGLESGRFFVNFKIFQNYLGFFFWNQCFITSNFCQKMFILVNLISRKEERPVKRNDS